MERVKASQQGGACKSHGTLAKRAFFSFVPHQMKMLFAELAVFLALDGLVLRDPLTYICSVNENAHDSVSERLRRWTRNPLGSARRGSNPLAVVLRSHLG